MSSSELAKQESNQPATTGRVSPDQMLQLAIEKGADLDKLEKLMDLRDRWEQNEARKAFVSAMNRFKENPPKLTKNKHVSYTTNKGTTAYNHATLDHVCEVIGSALSKVGISYAWETKQEGGAVEVTCVLTHEFGHSQKTTLASAPDQSGGKNSIQAVGSAVTYLQRYTLLAATGMAVAEQDNDGNPPATDYIGAGQAKKLRGALKAAGMSEQQFCQQAGIATVENLEANRFGRAMAHLQNIAQGGGQ